MDRRERLSWLQERGLLDPGVPGRARSAERCEPEDVARALGGTIVRRGDAACVLFDAERTGAGPDPEDLEALAWLAGVRLRGREPRALFLDVETTGTAGGTGTPVILTGVAESRGDVVRLRQYLLPDLSDEAALAAAVADELAAADVLITFNGKRFDVPLLATRAILAGRHLPLPPLHIDLLYPARRLYRPILARCDQRTLERHLAGARPDGDITGAEVPALYAIYLAERDPALLHPILEHNRHDLEGLARLARSLARRVRAARSGGGDPEDGLAAAERCGMAGICLDQGDARTAAALARSVLAGVHGTHPLRPRALEVLARAARRLGDHDEAAAAWRELAGYPGPPGEAALVELAKHYEHRLRRPDLALECVERALERVRRRSLLLPGRHPGRGPRLEELQRRRQRLLRRLGRA